MAYSTISKPSLYFNTKLTTGTGNSQAVTGVGFQPDWIWGKRRDSSGNNSLFDAVRGITKGIESNSNGAEFTSTDYYSSFDSDGFTIAAGSSGAGNGNSQTAVQWCWKGNGAGSTNTDGSLNSTVSVNTAAGFSIVKWDTNGSAHTVGHGLGTAPNVIFAKPLHEVNNWMVYHDSLTDAKDKYMVLDGNNAVQDYHIWNDTAPTSSVFSWGAWSGNDNGGRVVAYCFTEKKGYSKFGSYNGNGNANGTFVYTGFSPAWVLVKRSDAAESWFLYDNKRNAHTGNDRYYVLRPNTNSAENTTYSDNWQMDFLSNGFKLRTSAGHLNSGNLIYMAFAEEPLVANVGQSIPATAR